MVLSPRLVPKKERGALSAKYLLFSKGVAGDIVATLWRRLNSVATAEDIIQENRTDFNPLI